MERQDHHNTFETLKEKLTAYQRSLHFPEDEKENPDYPGNIIYTPFYAQYRKSTWYLHFPEKLGMITGSSEKHISYSVNHRPHGLLYTDLYQRLPSVIAEEGYEIKWTHNIGSNIAESITLEFNDDHLQSLDYIAIDMCFQSMLPEHKKKALPQLLGNIGILTEWNTALPSFTTIFPLPWFYAKNHASFFPLFYCGFLDRVVHRVNLRHYISELLLVRDAKTKMPVKVSNKTIKLVDGSPPRDGEKMALPYPQMWGEYLYLTPLECDYNRCIVLPKDGKSARPNMNKNVLYIEDVICIDSKNPVALTTKYPEEIVNTRFPVHAIGLVAQNKTAVDNKYYSNYSTNAENHFAGWSPICHTSFHHGNGYLFKELPSAHTERGHAWHHYPSVPSEPGFNFWSLGVDPCDSSSPPPAIVLNNSRVEIKLDDTNPYIALGMDEASADKYNIRLRLFINKRLTFKSFPLSDDKRKTVPAEVIIEGGS